MNSNSSSNTSSPSGYRAIAPSPQSMSIINPMIPISPHQSPQTRPNQQHMISLPPPFGTPPVSPFSHPMANAEYLPPPLQPLPPMMSLNAPPSPTSGRILPKQKGPATSVFSIPMTPSNANSVIHHYPYQHRVSINGTSTITNGDKQQLSTADQRELARKVSHSAIERRRRERINDKIMQLKELIPSCADQDHLHKLSILQSAIEYIQYLQGCVAESRKRGTDNNEERSTKKSKFDRYEIPIPKNLNNNSNNNSNSNNDSDDSDDSAYKRKNNKTIKTKTKTKKETSDASTNTDPVKSKKHQSEDEKEKESINNEKHEEADALLLLSKSSPSTTSFTNENTESTDDKKILKTRDVEIQTFSNVTEIDDDEEEEEEEKEKEIPTRRMTVQQLLCN